MTQNSMNPTDTHSQAPVPTPTEKGRGYGDSLTELCPEINICVIPIPKLDKKMDAGINGSTFFIKEMLLEDIRVLMSSNPLIIDVLGISDGRAA